MRWPWSWPVEVPARLVADDGATIELTSRGTIYDFAAHVGKGYTGTLLHDSRWGPIELEYKIGRRCLREMLRKGSLRVVGR